MDKTVDIHGMTTTEAKKLRLCEIISVNSLSMIIILGQEGRKLAFLPY
jgi:hypothetical protein